MFKGFGRQDIFFLVMLLLLACLVRFYDFPRRLIFGPEQALSLMTAGQMLRDKFSLLGEAYIQRTTASGLFLFHGALFSYSLIPLELLFKYNPWSITIFFTLLNILTGILLYILVKRVTNRTVAWFSAFLFFFNSKMIHHSLFIWILNYLPLIGLISFYLMWCVFKQRKALKPIFWLGILSGIGFSLQYVYALSAAAIFIYLFFVSRKKIKGSIMYFLGALLPNLPMIIFDIKHGFYHLNTLYQYFLDAQSHKVSGFYTYYQFLNLWPLFSILGGLLLAIIFKRHKIVVILFLVSYVLIHLYSPYSRLMPKTIKQNEITLANLQKAAGLIAQNNPPTNFNVATLWDFDTRANPLRYLLIYNYNKNPQVVEEYTHLDALYAFAPENYDMVHPRVWELQTFLPYQIIDLPINLPGYHLYKLIK